MRGIETDVCSAAQLEPERPTKSRLISRRRSRGSREREPEGFGEAVSAGAVTLALMISAASVGFAWDRYGRQVAHAYAVGVVERVAADGPDALLPPWSGMGLGPESLTAKATFEAVRNFGRFAPRPAGDCEVASNFSLCDGTRYRCLVSGDTPVGPEQAVIGLCESSRGPPWSIDMVDVTIPLSGGDVGNRAVVDPDRDGPIRYGTALPQPEPMPVRQHLRWRNGPLKW